MPVTIRESGTSDDEYVYLLFIGDEYFELMFEYVSQEHYIDETNNKEIYRYKYILKKNASLTKRADKRELIYLIREATMWI